MPSESVDLRIRPGMSESRDSRMLSIADGIATPRLIQNYRFRQLDRAEKRPGTQSRGTTGLPTAGSGLWVSEWNGLDAVCIEDTLDSQIARSLYVRDASAQWNYAGRTGFVVPERRTGVTMDSGVALFAATCVAINGVLYVAWAETGDIVHLTAMDPGGTIFRDVTLSTASEPRLIYTNSVLYLVYRDNVTIRIRTVTLGTLALSAASAVATTLRASGAGYDAAPMEGGTTWLLAYPEDATHIRVRVMSGTTSSADTTIVTTNPATFVAVVGTSSSKVVVAYVDSNDAEVSTFSDTLTGAANVVVQTAAGNENWFTQSGIVRTGSNEWHVVFAGQDTTAAPTIGTLMLYHARINGTPSVTEGPYKGFRFLPCSKPFVTGDAGSRRVSIVAHDASTSVNASHCILDLETQGSPHGGGQQLSAISHEHTPVYTSAIARHNTEVASVGGAQYFVPIRWSDPNDIEGYDALVFRSAATNVSMAWAERAVQQVAGALCVSGGALYEACSAEFSGSDYICENGFVNEPEINTAVAAGGSMTSGQEYTYVATYAWLDPLGNRIHRSAPCHVDTVTPSGGNLSVTVRILALACGGRFGTNSGNVVAEVYRSWNGGPFYYVDSTSTVLVGTASSTVTDASADATVEVNRTLYTDGGILATYPPSGARLLCKGGGRVWTVGWKPRVPEFSKLMIPTAPVEFCDDDTFRIHGIDEDITAIAWMDGHFIAWSKQSIFLVTGDGPNDQGVGAFSDPRRMPCTVGADSKHVAEVSQGLIYKGAGTFWLLPRGFGPPQPVGDEIQETLASFPYLRSAVRCSNGDDDCTHFTLANADTTTAETKVAIYDNRTGGWSLDDIAGEVGAAGAVDGKFTWMIPTWDAAADVPVRQFTTSSNEDLAANNATSTWIESKIGFGTWHLAGVFGVSTVRSVSVFGEIVGSCVVKLDSSIDHASASTFTTTQGTTGVTYLQHQLETRTRSAFRFDIYDAENSGKTAGLALHSVAVEVEKLPGPKAIPPTSRF